MLLAGCDDARPHELPGAQAPGGLGATDGRGARSDSLSRPHDGVKPARFEYHAPASVDEAVELLSQGNGTHVLAGGQSLVQLMKFRTAKPSALVDVNGVGGLDVLEERDGELHVGATVRQQQLLENDTVDGWPLLREAARFATTR